MIRQMREADVPRVAEIHVFGWRAAYRGIVADAFLFGELLVTKRMEYFYDALQQQREESYVYDDGIIKAVLTIGNGRDADKQNAFELWGIYVEPLLKREGIGRQMVLFCEETARARGFSEVYLWVLGENKAARAFYERLGYEADGARKRIDALGVVEMRYGKRV